MSFVELMRWNGSNGPLNVAEALARIGLDIPAIIVQIFNSNFDPNDELCLFET